MPPHGWILALCLCHSLLGTLCAVSPDEDGTTRTSPKPQLSTEPGDLGLGSPWPTSGRRASSFWSFWAPVDLTTEAKTPSLLSLPFSLPFDLWSPSTRVPEESVPAHTSLGVTLALPSNDTVTEGSKGTSPNPATGPTWAESSATPRTGTVTLHEETDPPTPALPNSSYRPAPSLTTWLSVSPSSEKTLMPARQTEASTALPDRSTSALALGAGTTEPGEPARPHNQPSATPAPVTEAAKPTFAETAGTEAKIDAGLFGEGTRAVEEHVEGGGATRGDRGAFEDAVQAPTRAVSLSAEPSGGKWRCALACSSIYEHIL
ncbi:hypothetical protein MATL_G00258220 [Megalops atlanticus]|uniref:Uncharacterized protein n=1 Tax=Megalops atlanticus TaxID=7932 RepID=A0A9D3STW7_MEGAT|nr:hypothetical protein MATL_G00258220 [Megalops atlanticus]